MRGRLVTILALLVIAVCALIVASRINSAYRVPDAPDPSPAPLVPNASATASPTASATAAAPAATTARPGRTVTTWVTVTPPPSAGEDGQ